MADQQGLIYDPILKRGVTPQEANQLIAERSKGGATQPQQPGTTLAVSNPMNNDQHIGLSLPPMSQSDAQAVLKAFPQLAGTIAQFLPAATGVGMAASVGIPMMAELGRQAVSGEDSDMSEAATQGALGGISRFGGNAMRAMGTGGKSLIKRSLNLGGSPFAYNEVAERVIPKLALSERSAMTSAGVETARKRAAQTGSGGLQDLADVLEKGRYDSENAPALSGGGLMTLITRFLDNPKQLKIGQQLAQPLGLIDTGTTGAQSVETLLRSLMAALSSQRGDSETRRRQP